MGRPSKYDPRIARRICERLPFETIQDILGKPVLNPDDDMPNEEQEKLPCVATFYRWLLTRPELQALYRMAMEIRSHVQADEIIQIADDDRQDWLEEGIDEKTGELVLKPRPEQIARARLRIDTRKFLMAKRAPAKYGEGFRGANPFLNLTDEEIDAYLENAERERRDDSPGESGKGATAPKAATQGSKRSRQKSKPAAPRGSGA